MVLFLIAKTASSQNIKVDYDYKTRGYGVKNVSTNQWLIKPVNREITGVKDFKSAVTKFQFFVVNNGKKMFIVAANGAIVCSRTANKTNESRRAECLYC